MSVKLILPTTDVEQTILYCARVSNPSNQDSSDTGLLSYLIRNQHWSPFEMVSATLEINTTRAIARQILRHRSFSFQEFSQRYADPNELGFVMSDVRMQHATNRQSSVATDDERLKEDWKKLQGDVAGIAQAAYNDMLQRGVAKEVARNVLPEGLMASRLYMAGTLRSWLHYIALRSGNGTQLEHQYIAQECRLALYDSFPITMQAMDEVYGGEN